MFLRLVFDSCLRYLAVLLRLFSDVWFIPMNLKILISFVTYNANYSKNIDINIYLTSFASNNTKSKNIVVNKFCKVS